MHIIEEEYLHDRIDAFVSSVSDEERLVLEELVVLSDTPDAAECLEELVVSPNTTGTWPKAVEDICFKLRLDARAFLSTKIIALSEETELPCDLLQNLIKKRILH